MPGTLKAAAANLGTIGQVPTAAKTIELVADKGYHSRAVLKDSRRRRFEDTHRRAAAQEFLSLARYEDARAAVYANRNRLRSEVGKAGMRKRAEIVERSFAHNLERGGMRRTWLRGRENVHKRYLIHVAGHNLGILMRLLIGAGTPKEAATREKRLLLVIQTAKTAVFVSLAIDEAGLGILVVIVSADPD